MASRHRWGMARTAVWMGAAFAAGCIPSARIVTRALSREEISDLGDGKPGAANVTRSLGTKAGAVVLGLDALKAFTPATAARLAGAPDPVVALVAVTPMVSHILVVGGRGAACALGACYAIDAKAMTISLIPLVGGSKLGYHPQSVMVTAFTIAALHAAFRRKPDAALGFLVPAILIAARLAGSRGAPRPASARVWWNRFAVDRDA